MTLEKTLRLAAYVAGYTLTKDTFKGQGVLCYQGVPWNPLQKLEQAAKLSLDLRMNIVHSAGSVLATAIEACTGQSFARNEIILRATRAHREEAYKEAVVLLAAQMGEYLRRETGDVVYV